MRARPTTLATAGKQFSGPPEGYGRKKELQVKHWLHAQQQAADDACGGAPEIIPEPSLYPNQSLDDVYRQLRDSADCLPELFGINKKDEVARISNSGCGASPATAAQHSDGQQQHANGAALQKGSAAVAAATSQTAQLENDAVTRASRSPAQSLNHDVIDPDASSAKDEFAERLLPAAHVAGANLSRNVPFTVGSPQSFCVAPAVVTTADAGKTPDATSSAGLPSCQHELQLSAPAAAIFHMLSCVDAGQQVDNPEMLQLRQALIKAAQDHQEYMQRTRAELAAARLATDAARAQAAQNIAEIQAQLAAAQQQLTAAEAQAASALAAGIAAKQEAKLHKLEADDAVAEQAQQLQHLQEQLQFATQHMREQEEKHKQALQQLQQHVEDARQEAAGSKRQLHLLQASAAVKESHLTVQLQAASGQVLQLQQEADDTKRQLQQVQQTYQQEQLARQAAEDSEARAIQAAAEHAEMFDLLIQEVQKNSATMQRRARLQVVGGQLTKISPAARPAPAMSVDRPAEADQAIAAASAGESGMSLQSPARTPPGTAKRSLVAATVDKASAAAFAKFDMAQHRTKCHKQLQRGLKAERKALAEIAAVHRRAAAAAELEESKKVQQLLSAAPEMLKVLGLAYRAYVLAPCGSAACSEGHSLQIQTAESSAQPTELLLQQLSVEYHLYIDSIGCGDSIKHSGCDALASTVIGLSAAVVWLLPVGNDDKCNAAAATAGDGRDASAALNSCLPLLLKAVRHNKTIAVVGVPSADEHGRILEMAAAAGWSEQECLMLSGALNDSILLASVSDVTAALGQLRHCLGLNDMQISLLPQSAMKKLAAATADSLSLPDLHCFNCSTMTHLKLDLAEMQQAAEQALRARQQPPLASSSSSPSVHGQQQPSHGMAARDVDRAAAGETTVLQVICSLLQGNRTLKVLKLEGVTAGAAESLAHAICSCDVVSAAGSCATGTWLTARGACGAGKDGGASGVRCKLSILSLNGMAVPIRALLGNQDTRSNSSTATMLQDLDLRSSSVKASDNVTSAGPTATEAWGSRSIASAGVQQQPDEMLLTEAQAVFLAVLLPHCSCINRLKLPLLAPGVSEEAAGRLIDAVLQLPQLQLFNGIKVQLEQQQDSTDTSQRTGISNGWTSMVSKVPVPEQLALIWNSNARGVADNQQHMQQNSFSVVNLAGKQLGAPGAALIGRLLRAAEQALEGVVLTGCQLGQHGVKRLAANLADFYPTASFNDPVGPNTGRWSPHSAAGMSQLQVLQLSANQLAPTGLLQLLSGLSAASGNGACLLQQLRVLDIGYNQLADEGCAVLGKFVQHLPQLQLLGLSGNGIGPDGVKALLSTVCNSRPCTAGTHTTALQTASASRGNVRAFPNLRVLQLGCNFVGDAGVVAVAGAMPTLRQLRQLELQENYSIGCDGVRALAAALADAPSLVELNLAKNNIGPQGAKLLAAGLQSNAAATAVSQAMQQDSSSDHSSGFLGLKYVELEWCKLKVEGVVHLAAALVQRQQGTAASEAGNSKRKNAKGATAAATAAAAEATCQASHCCLTKLGLARNGAGDKGVKALSEALATNTSLQCIDLRGNSIGLVGCRLLSGLLQSHNATIKALLLEGNMDASADSQAPVLQALEELASADRSGLVGASK